MTPDNPNLQYCLQFLKNGGEFTRAVRLCMDCTKMPIQESIEFVSSLSTNVPCEADRRPQMETYCSECNATFRPETPECPLCQNPNLILRAIKQ